MVSTILIVDDDKDILRITKALLSSEDHHVIAVESALLAMDVLNATPVDAVVSDANMPHYDGFDLVRTIRNDRRYDNVGVAMLTGRRAKRDVEAALRVGVDDYILKPIDPTLFLSKISQLLSKKPGMERPIVKLASAKINSKGTLNFPIEILTVSELGLTLRAPFQLDGKVPFTVSSGLFTDLGLDLPPLKVTQCQKVAGAEEYEISVTFCGANDKVLKRIRAWIVSKYRPL